MKAKILTVLTSLILLSTSALHAQMDDDLEATDLPPEEVISTDIGLGLGNYQLGNGVSFVSKTDSYRINLSGYVQASMQNTAYSHDDEIYSRFRIRRARIRLNGYALGNKIRYRLGVDLVQGSETDEEGTGSTLSDAWIQYRPFTNSRLAITFGQRSTPTDNKELLISTYSLQLAERSKLSSVFGTVREVGLFVEDVWKVSRNSYLKPALAITDGSGAITPGARLSGMKYGARMTYLPFGLMRLSGETREGDLVYEIQPKLALSAAYSYANKTSDRRGGRDNGTILYKALDSKPNGYDLPSMGKLTADFMFKYRGFSLLGEFAKTWAYVPSSIAVRVRADGTTTTTFPVDPATGENGTGPDDMDAYVRNRMMLGTGYNLQGGYMLRSLWSIDARYSHFDPDKYSYMRNNMYYMRNDIYDLGVTKYLTKSYAAKIQATFQLAKTDGVCREWNGTTFKGWEKNFYLLFQLAF